VSLEERLRAHAARGPEEAAVAATVQSLADAALQIGRIVARGPLAGALAASVGKANTDGDTQRTLDVVANDIVIDALKRSPTAYLSSEEEDAILTLNRNGLLAVAVDPLDGSSNIDVNVSIGTIFSIHRADPVGATASFFRPGSEQLAAGYVVYGPHVALVLTLLDGVDLYVHDRDTGRFELARARVTIPAATSEFAINTSNYRHWYDPVRNFVDDCVAGAEGPRGKDFNMRWVASLVAETHRIFSRGGVFLYPADRRKGYEHGRLRLVYEAAPMALLVEQAGGLAIDGSNRILDRVPASLHERTPLIFGSAQKVGRIRSYHNDPAFERSRAPLFASRGLFRG
jgi:fructose-1,6-bisphosphatase I